MTASQIELETKIAFLEQHINELSDVLYAQQKTIDALERDQKRIKDQLGGMHSSQVPDDADEKPPHY